MKVAIVGGGIVGLTLCDLLADRFLNSQITVYDKQNLPNQQGTSIRNSGVLHAGLYYKAGSLKARLCVEGGKLMRDYIIRKKLPLLECGKLLVPNAKDTNSYLRLQAIYQNAKNNGCFVELINEIKASKIQPGIIGVEQYLWSPKTAVFNPEIIINTLFEDLLKKGIKFEAKQVEHINSQQSQLVCNGKVEEYDYIINVSGYGSLQLLQNDLKTYENLFNLPILGQYCSLISGPKICTNIYPVPDPDLPFLGIHITPQYSDSSIIGPNAVPIFSSEVTGMSQSDQKAIMSRLGIHLAMFIQNKSNYRQHALSELTFSIKKKFARESKMFFSKGSDLYLKNARLHYGIRPQLVDKLTLEFVNDFMCVRSNNCLHVVNAISPAFTSSFALSEYIATQLFG